MSINSWPGVIFNSGTALICGSESFLSAAFFLITEVGVKARGDPEVTGAEATGASPCLFLKFSLCSSSFFLMRACCMMCWVSTVISWGEGTLCWLAVGEIERWPGGPGGNIRGDNLNSNN